jgi:hypothetical protein
MSRPESREVSPLQQSVHHEPKLPHGESKEARSSHAIATGSARESFDIEEGADEELEMLKKNIEQSVITKLKDLSNVGDQEIVVFPVLVGHFKGDMAFCNEACPSFVSSTYVKTMIVEIDGFMDIYITDFGSGEAHGTAVSRANTQINVWIDSQGLHSHLKASTGGSVMLPLVAGGVACKNPDMALGIRRPGQDMLPIGRR